MRRKFVCAIVGLMMVCIAPKTCMADFFDFFADFNNTGVQPASGNPFTYWSETSLNVGFTLFPNYGNTSCTGGDCQSAGTVNDYYLLNSLDLPWEWSPLGAH